MRRPILLRLRQEILDPEMETVLHPSPFRFKMLGCLTSIGQLIFWFIWAMLLPQPYENIYVRLLLVLLGIGIFFEKTKYDGGGLGAYKYSFTVNWLQLPVFFTWMYWMNHGNAVWLASMASMVLIYYHFTDWRLATIGLLTGVPLATAIAYWQLNGLPHFPTDSAAVLGFCFVVAIAFGASHANLRRERLRHSLVVMGIMAHELRTPLATASLIGQAIISEAGNHDEKARIRGLTKLAKRLEALTQTINHHIDLQMMNARFMQLPPTKQLISATGLVNKVVTQYPFNSRAEENCVEVITQEDFLFFGSDWQFTQVLNNLLKNALYSLKVAQSRFFVGDLRIQLSVKNGTGRICIFDKGMGINAHDLSHIFEPFFSTNHDTGHGLGLAYCKQVVQTSGGVIRVNSEPFVGATFTIDLPIQNITSDDNTNHAISSLSTS
jgi:two-component system, CAI-1 autoinducer sensor kinase/phosphatase CqsS